MWKVWHLFCWDSTIKLYEFLSRIQGMNQTKIHTFLGKPAFCMCKLGLHQRLERVNVEIIILRANSHNIYILSANITFTYYIHHIYQILFTFTIFENSGYCNSQDGQPALSAAKADSSWKNGNNLWYFNQQYIQVMFQSTMENIVNLIQVCDKYFVNMSNKRLSKTHLMQFWEISVQLYCGKMHIWSSIN